MYNPELNTIKYNFDKKEYMEEYNKEYNEKNKEKLKEKICCRTCKCEIIKKSFKEHCRSKKHINNMKQPEKLDNI